RGTERLVHDLGVTLAARGHEVTLITSHPGPTSRSIEEGLSVLRLRRPPPFPPLRWYEDHVDSAPVAMGALLRGRFDVAHAFHPAYAWAAVRASRFGAPPVAFSFHGIPERGYLVQRRYRLEMMQRIVSEAAAVTVLSERAAEVFRRYLLREPTILPGGVVGEAWKVDVKRREKPTLVCAASLGDPRKRADLLLSAFSALRERDGEVSIRLVKTPDPFLSPLEHQLPPGAEFVEADATGRLAREYASAHATVLPSVGEAFGLVALESLAAGTPVVAARGGATAELISEGETGELFEAGNEDDLAAALARAIALGQTPGVEHACRLAVEPFDWSRLFESHESLYDDVAKGAPR
ncbi:MAG: glycosyltransferase family 4 protein, partial [Actinomycetota bacterium]|nr:glycosyltransferase family 4 protein [Actinomycetota bacterium]